MATMIWGLGLARKKDEQRTVPSLGKMKLLCVALALQALLVLQVHCAGKKAASSEPKVTSQVTRFGHTITSPVACVLKNLVALAQVFFDIEIDDKPAGKHFESLSRSSVESLIDLSQWLPQVASPLVCMAMSFRRPLKISEHFVLERRAWGRKGRS